MWPRAALHWNSCSACLEMRIQARNVPPVAQDDLRAGVLRNRAAPPLPSHGSPPGTQGAARDDPLEPKPGALHPGDRSRPDGHDEHLFHGTHARYASAVRQVEGKTLRSSHGLARPSRDEAGRPIGYEVFPGNTSDVEAFRKMLRALKTRFQLRRVIICADRGMVGDEILKELRGDGVEYIVGAGPSLSVEDAISYTGANWQPVEEINIRIKPMGDGETYIVCYNPAEAEHDRDRRREIVARLRRQLGENPSAKSLLRNSSFKSYVRLGNAEVEINEEKIRQAARYDGKYVLRSNASLTAKEAALAYRQLLRVERAFRDLKGPLKLRPIYYFTDRRIRAHIMVCFLAYALEMALRQALGRQQGVIASEGDYHEIMQDLARLSVGKLVSAAGHC